jgi:hypothetical protein
MSDSIFNTIFTKDLKNLYNDAIDSILADNGLTVPCRLVYSGSKNTTYCNNCVFDPISKLSNNIYNNTGPVPFAENTICPVCMGMGMKTSDSSEILYLAVIFDSKYFMNTTSSSVVNIVDGMVQTICQSSLLPKIRNADEIVIDTNIEKYGGYTYQRAGDPSPAGFGDHRYIMTMWKRK